MENELFYTLIGPILFATAAGGWAFKHRAAQRSQVLLTLILLFLTGAWSQYRQPSSELFYLLLAFSVFLVGMMVLGLRTPAPQRVRNR